MSTPLNALKLALKKADNNMAELERMVGVKAGRIAVTKRRLERKERYQVGPLLALEIEKATGVPAVDLCPKLNGHQITAQP